MVAGLNIPNFLTLTRIGVIPLIIATFYCSWDFAQWIRVVLFAYACFTDFLDGFLARRWHLVSPFGRFLDPLADKLLVASVLLMLVGTHQLGGIHLIPAVIILCREIMVSGLREMLAELQQVIRVSSLAQWKTGTQMLALGILLSSVTVLHTLGLIMVWVAAILTLISGYEYLRHSLRVMHQKGITPK